MPTHPDDELPTLELADLTRVTGGAGMDMSAMMPMMMMMMTRGRSQAAAAPAPMAAAEVPAWTPKVTINGVEQPMSSAPDGSFTVTSDVTDTSSGM